MSDYDFQLEWHLGDDYGEWGSQPRGPLVHFDMAHQGELMDSVIGVDPATGKDRVYHVVRCEICILTHLWPLPSQASLDSFYETLFYEQEKPDMIAHYEQDRAWWMACVHGPILETCAQALGAADDAPPSILDVGAGPGLLLRTAQARGWRTTAIEPSLLCATRLAEQGHTVWNGTLWDYVASVRDAHERYDVVTLYETLEHMSNPEEALLQVYDLLRPGGVVAVVVPNDWSPLQLAACKKLGLPHYWISAPAHVSYFTAKTAQLMLRRTGFDIIDCRGTYPLEQFLLDGRNYVGHDDIGRNCHTERMAWELTAVQEGRWPIVEEQYRTSMVHRIGRELVMIGRRHA